MTRKCCMKCTVEQKVYEASFTCLLAVLWQHYRQYKITIVSSTCS